MVRANRGIRFDHGDDATDEGSRMVLDNIEHPGLDTNVNAAEETAIAGEGGFSVVNPETGVTAVWLAGERIPLWASDLQEIEAK